MLHPAAAFRLQRRLRQLDGGVQGLPPAGAAEGGRAGGRERERECGWRSSGWLIPSHSCKIGVPVRRRAWEFLAKHVVQGRAKQLPVQILVVVASIQMGLKWRRAPCEQHLDMGKSMRPPMWVRDFYEYKIATRKIHCNTEGGKIQSKGGRPVGGCAGCMGAVAR